MVLSAAQSWINELMRQISELDYWVQVMLKLVFGLIGFFFTLVIIAYIRLGIAKIRGKPIKRPPAADWELLRREQGKKPRLDEWDDDV